MLSSLNLQFSSVPPNLARRAIRSTTVKAFSLLFNRLNQCRLLHAIRHRRPFARSRHCIAAWLSACSTALLRAIRQDSLTKYLAKDSGYGPDPRLSRGPAWPNTPLQIIATQETLKKIKSTNSNI
jgi:hypothetical protein